MTLRFILAGGLIAALLSGCGPNLKSSRGFRLPDGDVEKGKQAFLELKCNKCHKVDGVDLPPPTSFNLVLGGETLQVRTYGELVTSIINPSHVVAEHYKKQMADAKSPMPDLTHEMTVQQVIDLVAFLQPRYKLVESTHTPNYP